MILENEIIKRYLSETPLDERLPIGWEIRFGRRGKWMKYDSIEHCEKKLLENKSKEYGIRPFLPLDEPNWQHLKSNFGINDELWLYGTIGDKDCLSICLVRDEIIIEEINVMNCCL